MRKHLLLLVVPLGTAIAMSAQAQNLGYQYDGQTGANRQWSRDGAATQTGTVNLNTGNRLNSGTGSASGRTFSGWDAQGNYFLGNDRSGYYYNFSTGRMCIGTGEARTCY